MKSRWTSRLVGAVLSVTLFCSSLMMSATQAGAQEVAPNLQLAVKSAILVEASTGKVLYKNNPDIPLPPASMTKMMTEYLVLEAVKQNKIKWEDQVPVSEYAFWVAKMSDSAGVYLNMGESHAVKDLYKAMAIASANDATVLLAEKVAGSEPNFVQMMNKKAQELGMTNTFYATSSGLPANELGQYAPTANNGRDNVMSARDAAILARALIRDFPDALEYSKIPRLTFREGTANPLKKANYNWMLPGLPNEYPGVDGLKTGYTAEAKYCFTGTAIRDNLRLITVVMGTDSEQKRFVETKKLLDYGFSTFKLTKKLDKGASIKGFETAPVSKGVELEVPAVIESDLNDIGKIGQDGKVEATVEFNKDLVAPIKKGDVIGKVILKGETYEYLSPSETQKSGINVVAAQDVEEASWIRLLFRSIIQFFGDMFSGATGK
ncbi:D-alanyl-D-alanine carboxypeptidase family protein [Brevibacillus dissolubilis]|uniref:D-alanyl-D-alanine carboxypeptidase family protein n=1 Tax=Brevibacillus dissolubilis TaxID=1844116 RepID=UPI0011173E80|nr:D-alanyl-D-alanine carboxypeptidase family protein [Brevibacillus dissolubilis]